MIYVPEFVTHSCASTQHTCSVRRRNVWNITSCTATLHLFAKHFPNLRDMSSGSCIPHHTKCAWKL